MPEILRAHEGNIFDTEQTMFNDKVQCILQRVYFTNVRIVQILMNTWLGFFLRIYEELQWYDTRMIIVTKEK